MIEFSECNSAETMDRLSCSICMEVVRHPKVTPCKHNFCQKCLTDWMEISPTCPICRQPMQARDIKEASRQLKSELSSLKVRCTFHDRGCKEEMELKDLSRHEEVCKFQGPRCSRTDCKRPLQQREYSDEPVLKTKKFCGKRCLEDYVTNNYVVAYRRWKEWPYFSRLYERNTDSHGERIFFLSLTTNIIRKLRKIDRSITKQMQELYPGLSTAEELDRRWNLLAAETTTILRDLLPASGITVESNYMNSRGTFEPVKIHYTPFFSDVPVVSGPGSAV